MLYARVASVRQAQDGTLTRQTERLRQAAAKQGYEVVAMIAEHASSLNEHRRRMKQLLALIGAQATDVVLVESPDRLVRFGFSYLEQAFGWMGVRLEVLDPPKQWQPTEEVVQDVLTIVTVFAGRLYGSTSPGACVAASKRLSRNVKIGYRPPPRNHMGQASRTTKLLLDLGNRTQGGANTEKRAALAATSAVLTEARAFYSDFFLAHADKLAEKVTYYSEEHLEMRERLMSAHELLTWAEACTVATASHPHPWPDWNFSERFPAMPFAYRRSVIKDAIGKVRSYLSHRAKWEKSGKKKGKPGLPAATDHPTLYQGCFSLDLEALDTREAFVRIHVYAKGTWTWMHYPVSSSRYTVQRLLEAGWQRQSPTLVLRAHAAELHIPQVKKIAAKKVMERKQDPDLVTVAIDLNVKNLAVITVRQHDAIIETVFVSDHGLDAHRYRHLKRIAKKQWQSGRPVAGEHSNRQLWWHIDRLNEDAAHKVARRIATVCASYPGCILLFERLRKIKPGKGSKSRRMNRRRANQLRGKIREYAKDKAYVQQVVTVEVNPHGTSQYCSRCGALGERFSFQQGQRIRVKWGKLFCCAVCHYEANADFNASVNVHRSFYREGHWQIRKPKQASVLVEDSA